MILTFADMLMFCMGGRLCLFVLNSISIWCSGFPILAVMTSTLPLELPFGVVGVTKRLPPMMVYVGSAEIMRSVVQSVTLLLVVYLLYAQAAGTEGIQVM
jgi:hypothetical protein